MKKVSLRVILLLIGIGLLLGSLVGLGIVGADPEAAKQKAFALGLDVSEKPLANGEIGHEIAGISVKMPIFDPRLGFERGKRWTDIVRANRKNIANANRLGELLPVRFEIEQEPASDNFNWLELFAVQSSGEWWVLQGMAALLASDFETAQKYFDYHYHAFQQLVATQTGQGLKSSYVLVWKMLDDISYGMCQQRLDRDQRAFLRKNFSRYQVRPNYPVKELIAKGLHFR